MLEASGSTRNLKVHFLFIDDPASAELAAQTASSALRKKA